MPAINAIHEGPDAVLLLRDNEQTYSDDGHLEITGELIEKLTVKVRGSNASLSVVNLLPLSAVGANKALAGQGRRKVIHNKWSTFHILPPSTTEKIRE